MIIARLLPASLHRMLLPLAYRIRHAWRMLRKVPLHGCVVLIEDLNGSVLLLRHSYGPKVWALPGGGVGKGETSQEAAAREISEELGLSLTRLSFVDALQDTVSGSPHTVHLFASVTDQSPSPDLREVIEARFFPLHSLPEPLSIRSRACIELWRKS